MLETNEQTNALSLINKLQSLKNSPETFDEVKNVLQEKYEQLCKRLHGLTLIPEKWRATFWYWPLVKKFSLKISSRNAPSSPEITMSDKKILQFNNSNNSLTLILKEPDWWDTNSEKIYLQSDDIVYYKKDIDTYDSSKYITYDWMWKKEENQKEGRTSLLSFDDIIDKLVLWIGEIDAFEKQIDTICIRNDDEVKNNFGPQTNTLHALTTYIHSKMLQTSFGSLGEKIHKKEIRNKKLSNGKIITLTINNSHISVDNEENETLQSGIDWSFIYFYAHPDDYVTQQKIILHADGSIECNILKKGTENEKITYTYALDWSDPNHKNYEIYRNLLNFLTIKRQACAHELKVAWELRDVDWGEWNENVGDLKSQLLEE